MALYLGSNQITPVIMASKDNPYAWLNPEAEYKGKIYEWNGTLDDTTYSSWSPSTKAGTILSSSSNVVQYTISDRTVENAYFIGQWNIDFNYKSGVTPIKIPKKYCFVTITYYYLSPGSYPRTITGEYTSYTFGTLNSTGLYYLVYYNSSGDLNGGSVSYGPAYTTASLDMTTSVSGNSVECRLARPALYARCSNTYFPTSKAADIDTTHSTINFRIDAFKGNAENNISTSTYRLLTAAFNDNYGF